MALKFATDYIFVENQTKFDAAEMNSRFSDVDQRLNLLELNNVLTFYIPGVLAVGDIVNFVWPFISQNVSMGLAANTAPTDADLLFQLNVGGTDAFLAGERPTILDGIKFGVFSGNGTNLTQFTAGQQAILQVDQVGSTIAGSDLSVVIRGEKTLQ